MTTLQLKQFEFDELFTSSGLDKLDRTFISYLRNESALLADQLDLYRSKKLTALEISEFVIACAPILEQFISELFQIEPAVASLYRETHRHDPIFQFKDHYVHQSKRLMKSVTDITQFDELNAWLNNEKDIKDTSCIDPELSVATLGVHFLSDKEKYKTEIDKLVHWCVLAQQCDQGKKIIHRWRSFRQPQKKDYEKLVPMVPVENDIYARFEAPKSSHRDRDGFKLTDDRMSLRDVLDEIHYCVYCHKNEGDFCSKGFPVKKNDPELGLKINPLGDVLTGCPLEEKISEMNVVKKSGYGIGALAIITIDNPMCAVTGHRICNDCMKSCIYQKQDPVNIPEIETRVLTDVLNLPWGVEIYDLLIRWNPLRETQYTPKPYNNTKVMIFGMGPAGFTLAHHLLMEGCAVVGCDGLKIEPIPKQFIENPIHDFNLLKESLDDRIMSGFGGVSEYGITVRWDKNFLKLIYLSLMRRKHFQLFGNVRFGGTVTVEDAWELGFDHVAIAVGAGLPRELKIPNSLAPGMRQANDFLMALQLTGAVKKSSIANLQLRLPAVVIGGGLTGIDTATEAQAYYVVQVEKTHQRYHVLKNKMGETELRSHFDEQSLEILDEYLLHAEKIISERIAAKAENRSPKLNQLVRAWGGVTIAYRKSIQESPAYQRNHEEVSKALEEGIYYAEGLEPVSVILDKYGAADALVCRWRIQDESGQWIFSTEEQTIPAKSIFVATGAKPNIAYEFEHKGTFIREKDIYQGYDDRDGKLMFVENNSSEKNMKSNEFGIFTSYDKEDHRVSFIGDTNPLFHGSVVKAIASAKRGYPKIIDVLKNKSYLENDNDYAQFYDKMDNLFHSKIISVQRETNQIVKLTVHAPMAAKQFKAAQFYRIQNYETQAKIIDGTRLQTEAIASLGVVDSEKPDQLSFYIVEKGASTRLVSTFRPNDSIAIMGPTGAKLVAPHDPESILIVGNEMAIIYLLSVAPELKRSGHKIIFIGCADEKSRFEIDKINTYAEKVIWCDKNKITESMQSISLKEIKNIFVIGDAAILKTIQHERNQLNTDAKFTASVYGPMQCMLKGVCAQCLQWQIDPTTGKRTKAVYSCSWQHQPMDIIDIDNIDERLGQNRMQEILTELWVRQIIFS